MGVLAKANGALLPFYALLIEWIVLAPQRPPLAAAARRIWRDVMALLAVLPATLLLAYLAYVGIHTAIHGIAVRPWTEGQRLLSEPRVLMDYLGLLWLPRPFTPGLFNDQIRASLSLFSPATTLPALLAVLGLIGAGFALRRRAPLIALAILFYFAGQLLESTTIPLELYFEHRNYVPALLLFWPLAWWLADLRTLRLPKLLLMLTLPLGLALMTHARAEVWGNGRMQAELWARLNPDSPRAQANAAQFELAHGQPRDAIARLRPLLRQHPDQVQLAFNLLGARCVLGGVDAADLAAARTAMATTRDPGALLTGWFDRTLPVASAGGCPGLDLAALHGLIQAGLDNPRLDGPGRQQDLLYLRGRIALVERRPAVALADFERALDATVSPGFALEAAAVLGSAEHPRAGLALLDHYDHVAARAAKPGFGMPMLHAWVLRLQHYWPHEEAHLRNALASSVGRPHTAAPAATAPSPR
ncbi:MAG: tetratricopeptide repeat protein [Xanthomonadaceae bacterium]|nr:tetratricopeptide repeat protein [Xanthomonadaceae bacterium]